MNAFIAVLAFGGLMGLACVIFMLLIELLDWRKK